jgi:ankyrin repeat protein
LESLLAAGCDPNGFLKSPNESRPLEIAVSKDRIDVIKWLLDHGADPSIGRPLVAAINHEKSSDLQLAMLTLLLDGGASINQTYPLFGDETKRFSVLDWACLYRISEDVINYLKSRGAIHHWADDKIAAAQRELKPRRIVP